MIFMDKKEIYKKTISKYGAELQALVAIEEMSELIKAIIKIKRKIAKDENFLGERENLIEEIADVEIMIEQLKLIHHCELGVEKIKEKKLKRLLENLS